MSTVVDLVAGSSGTAVAVNEDGFVAFNTAGLSAFLFVPASVGAGLGRGTVIAGCCIFFWDQSRKMSKPSMISTTTKHELPEV
jgi:hypothetical protein